MASSVLDLDLPDAFVEFGFVLTPGAPLHAAGLRTPIGDMLAAAVDAGVCLFEFADRRAVPAQFASLRRWFGDKVTPEPHPHVAALEREIGEYFAGTRTRFDLPLALAGTPFQRAVWDRVAAIPYGQTRAYSQIAADLDNPGAVRAVGRANGDNRLAILIPCHRVIDADGSLRGYGGGLPRKRFLLALERRESSLFPTS